jgi:tetratricopeptide (TPR) repeat protein
VARNVGRALELQDRYAEALPWMDRALAGQDERAQPGAIRAQRAQVLFRLGRRDEALGEASAAVATLESQDDAEAPRRLALARVVLGRLLAESGRPQEAERVLAAAADWYDRLGPDNVRRAEASCELARARLLQGDRPEERQRLARCLPVYRAWGLAERETVKALESPRSRRPS